MKQYNDQQKGISLIEILIALLVSSIIMVAIMNLYSGFYGSNRQSQQLSSAQDKANFALNELSRKIRMSGAALCAKPKGRKLQMNPDFSAVSKNVYSEIPLLTTSTTSFGGMDTYNDVRLHSFSVDNADFANKLNTTLQSPTDASDILLVTNTTPTTLRIVDVTGTDPLNGGALPAKDARTQKQEMATSKYHNLQLSSPIQALVDIDNLGSTSTTAAQNVWLMVSDCDYSEVVYYPTLPDSSVGANILPAPNGGASASSTTGSPKFKRKYYHSGQTGLVAPIESSLYFVAKGSNGLALYERDLLASGSLGSATRQLMDGVASMKIEYLYDGPSGTKWYATNDRTDWDAQVPVKITLTMEDDKGETPFIRIIEPRN